MFIVHSTQPRVQRLTRSQARGPSKVASHNLSEVFQPFRNQRNKRGKQALIKGYTNNTTLLPQHHRRHKRNTLLTSPPHCETSPTNREPRFSRSRARVSSRLLPTCATKAKKQKKETALLAQIGQPCGPKFRTPTVPGNPMLGYESRLRGAGIVRPIPFRRVRPVLGFEMIGMGTNALAVDDCGDREVLRAFFGFGFACGV
jgi:hypothetical protein